MPNSPLSIELVLHLLHARTDLRTLLEWRVQFLEIYLFLKPSWLVQPRPTIPIHKVDSILKVRIESGLSGIKRAKTHLIIVIYVIMLFIKNFNNIWHLSSLNYSSQRKPASPQHTRQGSTQSGCLKTWGKSGYRGKGRPAEIPFVLSSSFIYLTVLTPRSPRLKPEALLSSACRPHPPLHSFGLYWLTAVPVCLKGLKEWKSRRGQRENREQQNDYGQCAQ